MYNLKKQHREDHKDQHKEGGVTFSFSGHFGMIVIMEHHIYEAFIIGRADL